MKTVLENYDVFPKVLPAGRRSEVTIRPLGRHARFDDSREYAVRLFPMNRFSQEFFRPMCDKHPYEEAHGHPIPVVDYFDGMRVYHLTDVRPRDGGISFTALFDSEQEYGIEVCDEAEKKTLVSARVYAVNDDLYGLIPLKGNMHVHSDRSDGKEAPEITAAYYRRAGYDFMAVTDHGLYEPSVEAMDAYRGLPMDMKLYPGEEVHAPDNNIHLIHFGGTQSVNAYCGEHTDTYYGEVEAIRRSLGAEDSHELYEYASCQWVFRKIREFGGLSILAHPCWIWAGAYNVRPDIYRRFLREGGFDALEVINGGCIPEENEAQVAIWQQARAEGSQVIATGSDDSHGTINGEWFDICKTYVLAKDNSRDAIFEAIRARRCVAVLTYRNESPHYYGDARMIAYLSFLDREYFPLHDELCSEEGRLMKAYVCGDESAARRMSLMKGQTAALAARLLGTREA